MLKFNNPEELLKHFCSIELTPSGRIPRTETEFKIAYVNYCNEYDLHLSAFTLEMGVHSTTPYGWKALVPDVKEEVVVPDVKEEVVVPDVKEEVVVPDVKEEVVVPEGDAHKHRDLIIAWANGAQIELLVNDSWEDVSTPVWAPLAEYRIKPALELKDNTWYQVQSNLNSDVWVALYDARSRRFNIAAHTHVTLDYCTVIGTVEITPI